ncbi:hypothetical protein [Lyngbya confervoides]|uniref:Uncharacterized protein n=1 Tax=Lyngbya confervoides BDU141951 TaxID=1574623 RepID=A0ABD4T7M0_9CYAN|nr:hypothetical protein [Lyngbya confervoides]MCM1984458.1 hypothetical protein [Lyngbya confervoides BDU141951]
MINRVVMERLGDELGTTQEQWQVLPERIKQAVERSLSKPVQAIQSNQTTVEQLTVELRKNSVIQASLKDSGWRGVLCSLEAIAQHQMLGLTVGAISLFSALLAGGVVWSLGWGDRRIVEFNRQAIERCYEKFALDTDGNGWFSCSGIQLPMNQ